MINKHKTLFVLLSITLSSNSFATKIECTGPHCLAKFAQVEKNAKQEITPFKIKNESSSLEPTTKMIDGIPTIVFPDSVYVMAEAQTFSMEDTENLKTLVSLDKDTNNTEHILTHKNNLKFVVKNIENSEEENNTILPTAEKYCDNEKPKLICDNETHICQCV